MNILAISGSLRAASNNAALLRAVAKLAPATILLELYADLDKLPLFNPDIALADSPYPASLRAKIMAADAVLIASPEYAHGITGAMKNALDWMVGCEAFVNKPVALLNASTRAVHAQAALRETLVMMSAQLIASACITVPLSGGDLTADSYIHNPLCKAALQTMLANLKKAVSASENSLV